MQNQSQIIQSVIQLLAQLTGEQDEYGEQVELSEVPRWSSLDAGQLGMSGGPMYDKSALMMPRAYMQAAGPSPVDAYGMPLDQEEGMAMMGVL